MKLIEKTIAFKFGLPPTLNEQIDLARSGWHNSARYKKIWTNHIAKAAIKQIPPEYANNEIIYGGKVWINYYWQVNSFANDQDNISAASKYVLDGLVDARIIKNDNLTIIQSPVIHWFAKIPRLSRCLSSLSKSKAKVRLPKDADNKLVILIISNTPRFTFKLMAEKYAKFDSGIY